MRRVRQGVALAAMAVASRVAGAQGFVQQILLVAPMHHADTTTTDAARRVTSELRSQIVRAAPKKSLDVPDDDAVYFALKRSGFKDEMPLLQSDERGLAQSLRADEIVRGEVSRTGNEYVVRAWLVLVRDARLREPLPLARAARPELAARALARSVTAARAQMPALRRCENARRDGDFTGAALAAAEAMRAYPGALARTCLLVSLTFQPIPADSLRKVADGVLAVDSTSIVAAVERAEALLALSRTREAAGAWQHVVLLAPDSVDLGLRATDALLRLREYELALEMSRALTARHVTTLSFPRLSFRSLIALGRWREAAQLGDSIATTDAAFAADSTYTVRHIEALRQSGDTLGALAASTAAIRRHAGDARLYLQYLQLIAGEAGTALARGVARFPDSPELYVMQVREARASGRRRDAIAAAEAALRRDPTLLQMYLQVADLWLDEQHADSAFDALGRAPLEGGAAAAVRSYALSRGTRLLRTAADTAPAIVRSAVPFLALADSLESGDDSRALRAVASLQLARADLMAASRTRGCSDARHADDALGAGRDALGRGISAAASGVQLQESYDQMRAAVDAAVRVYCKGPGATP